MYLVVVLDLFSRQVIGWSMRDHADTDLVSQALLSAIWRHKPKPGALIHSDQGSVYTSHDWQSFLSSYGVVCSTSRRGNCNDNAPVEVSPACSSASGSGGGSTRRKMPREPMYPITSKCFTTQTAGTVPMVICRR
jgi:putative transposase